MGNAISIWICNKKISYGVMWLNNNGEEAASANKNAWTATVFLEHSAKPTWALYR